MAGQLQDALVEPVPNVTAKAAPTCHLPGRKSSICCRARRAEARTRKFNLIDSALDRAARCAVNPRKPTRSSRERH